MISINSKLSEEEWAQYILSDNCDVNSLYLYEGEKVLLLEYFFDANDFVYKDKIITILLKKGACVNTVSSNGNTVLQDVMVDACDLHQVSNLLLLLDNGLNPDIQDGDSLTMLMRASYSSLLASSLLLNYGAKVDNQDKVGMSPLMYALETDSHTGNMSEYDTECVVRLFLNYGADRSLKNSDGELAIDIFDRQQYKTSNAHTIINLLQ